MGAHVLYTHVVHIHARRPKQIHIYRRAGVHNKIHQNKKYYNIDMHKLQFLFVCIINVRK